LAPGPRLALDAHVVGVGPQALGRITLGVGALPAAREETFALREVALVTRPSRLPAPAIPPALSTAALALAPPTEALPVPALLFPLGIVLLEIRQPVDLLQHPDALVALLQEGVEVGRLPAERGVLENRRQITGLALASRAQAGDEVALLHVGALDGLPLDAPGALGGLELARAVLRLVFFFLARDGEVGQAPLRQRDRRRHAHEQTHRERQRDEPRVARHPAWAHLR